MRKERRNPFRSSLVIEPAWRRWGLAAVSVVAYAGAFLPLYAETGVGVSALAIFPVVILGWLFGSWGGLLAGLLAMPANALLLAAVGEPGWRMVTGAGGLEGSALVVVVGAVIGLLRDLGLRLDRHLTEWRKAERGLRAAEDRYRILFERSRDAMYVSRPDGTLVAVNDAFLRLLGRDRDALEELRAHDLYEDPADRDRLLREIARTGWVEDHPVRLVGADGGVRDCLLTAGARYLPGAQRTVAEIQGSIRIVADDRTLHSLAERRTHELQDVVGELEAFTYSVSHDLRTHLVTMGGFASILWTDYRNELDPRALDFLERIMAASRRMDAFVQDLIDYSHVGRTPVQAARVELDDVVREALHRLAPRVAERNADVVVAPGLPAVEADHALVRCVLEKLLSNAVTFVPEGRRPRVDVEADVEDRRIRLKVRDNGVGLSPDGVERAFRAFERLEPGRFPGTGLGLTVVAKAVARMGGDVGVRSVPGEGSTFWVVLPAALPPELEED